MQQRTIDLKAILDDLKLVSVGLYRWEVPKILPMRAPVRIFTGPTGIKALRNDLREKNWSAPRQLVNVATLPSASTSNPAPYRARPARQNRALACGLSLERMFAYCTTGGRRSPTWVACSKA